MNWRIYQIIEQLHQIGAVKRGKFKLSSGKLSDIYIDLRMIPSYPKLFREITETLYYEFLPIISRTDAIVGVATGGIPWATALSMIASKPTGYVRSKIKDYGTSRELELHAPNIKNAIIIDDVATTGNSLLRAVKILKNNSVSPLAAIVIVNREEGTIETLRKEKVPLYSLLTLSKLRNWKIREQP